MGITLFTLFLLMLVPMVVMSSDPWMMNIDTRSNEELMEVFAEHPAYLAIYERFPDAKEEFEGNTNTGGGSLRVGVANLETGAQLILHLSTHQHNMHAHAECIQGNEGPIVSIDSLFVAEYISSTACIEPTS